jgi:hypothetical protein
MLALIGLAATARRQRGTASGQLQPPQASVGGKVGGDVCPLEVCSAVEFKP